MSEQLLASLLDWEYLRAWYEGGKKGEKPRPLTRPGFRPEKVEDNVGKTAGMTMDEAREWFDRYERDRSQQSKE